MNLIVSLGCDDRVAYIIFVHVKQSYSYIVKKVNGLLRSKKLLRAPGIATRSYEVLKAEVNSSRP